MAILDRLLAKYPQIDPGRVYQGANTRSSKPALC
jgi:hypothetical protein